MDSEYRFKTIPITPAIAEYIIESQLAGQQLRRAVIVDAVQKFHIENGGLPAEAADLVMTVKKALQNMKKKGTVANPSTGWWLIEQSAEAENQNSQSMIDFEALQELNQDRQNFTIESEHGTGEEAVYVYYYPAYKKAAQATNTDRWLCKIGRTNSYPSIRTSEQSTGMPEQPVIGLVYKTNDSRILESVLHGVLNLRGQWSEDSPGTEWFITSSDDVMGIIKLLIPEDATEKSPDV